MSKTKQVIEKADSDLEGDNLLTVKLARKDGETVLYVQAHEMLTDLIQNQEAQAQTSNTWGTEFTEGDEGYDFIKCNDLRDSVKTVFRNYKNDYGGKWMRNGKGNVAVLRTKGLEDGKYFEIDQPMTKSNLKKIQKDIKRLGDNLIDQFLKDVAFVSEIKEVEAQNTVQTPTEAE